MSPITDLTALVVDRLYELRTDGRGPVRLKYLGPRPDEWLAFISPAAPSFFNIVSTDVADGRVIIAESDFPVLPDETIAEAYDIVCEGDHGFAAHWFGRRIHFTDATSETNWHNCVAWCQRVHEWLAASPPVERARKAATR